MNIPKLGIIILILGTFAHYNVHAENETDLADTIMTVCDPNGTATDMDEIEECALYYTNCVVGKGGKWTDKDVLRCIKEKK